MGEAVRVRDLNDPSTCALTTLLSGLKPLKGKAKEFYERVTVEGYVENEEDIVTVSGLAEDLRDVLREYQVSIQKDGTTVGSLKP